MAVVVVYIFRVGDEISVSDSSESKTRKGEKFDINFFTFAKGAGSSGGQCCLRFPLVYPNFPGY